MSILNTNTTKYYYYFTMMLRNLQSKESKAPNVVDESMSMSKAEKAPKFCERQGMNFEAMNFTLQCELYSLNSHSIALSQPYNTPLYSPLYNPL